MIDRPVTIVATGPSAKEYNWDELRDSGRFVIAVAGAPTLLNAFHVVQTKDPHYRTGWSAAPELGYFSGHSGFRRPVDSCPPWRKGY